VLPPPSRPRLICPLPLPDALPLYGLGSAFAGRNATHQMKKLKENDLKLLRDSLRLPIPDSELEDPYSAPYYHPGKDAPEIEYMLDRRRQLGGFLPERRSKYTPVSLPG